VSLEELDQAKKEYMLACEDYEDIKQEIKEHRKKYKKKKSDIDLHRKIGEKLYLKVLGDEDKIRSEFKLVNVFYISVRQGCVINEFLDMESNIHDVSFLPYKLLVDVVRKCRQKFEPDHSHMEFMNNIHANYECAVTVFGGHPILTGYKKLEIGEPERAVEILPLPDLVP